MLAEAASSALLAVRPVPVVLAETSSSALFAHARRLRVPALEFLSSSQGDSERRVLVPGALDLEPVPPRERAHLSPGLCELAWGEFRYGRVVVV